jgi:hypothetical protein
MSNTTLSTKLAGLINTQMTDFLTQIAKDYKISETEVLDKWSSFTGLKKKAPKVKDEGPTVKQLKEKLKSVGLKTGGKKSELVERLAKFDRGELRPVALDTAKAIASGDYSAMTVKTLKDQLKTKGLKVSGKKSELVDRLSNSDNDTDTEDESDTVDYNSWTVKKIREALKTRGLKAKKGDKKDDLVDLLTNDDQHALSNHEASDSDSDSDSESDIEDSDDDEVKPRGS